METPEQEAARIRAEVVQEMDAEELGETPVVDAPPEPKASDPWDGVNPALKQAFDEMTNKVSVLQATENRLRQAESRIGAITNELHNAKKAKEAPSAAQIQAAAASDEKWETLKTDFPEWAEAFDGRFDKKLSEKLEGLREELKAEIRVPGEVQNLDVRLLTIIKPKWRETINTSEWKEWLAIQPEATRSKVSSERAEDAIDILSAFEETSRPQKTASEIAAERKQRMKTSVIPQGGKSVPVKSEADMSAAELRANIGKEIYAET